ncbi:hypothetical protein OH805_00275 [Streptomyces sp. NBC_00879]|nr:hypothetical protein OH805_00275 [Streptomyces sp. NBC_00879]
MDQHGCNGPVLLAQLLVQRGWVVGFRQALESGCAHAVSRAAGRRYEA